MTLSDGMIEVTVERRGDELYVESAEPVDVGDLAGLGILDPVDPELVLVGENLFLRAGRFGAFASETSLASVTDTVRAAHADFVFASRD